MSSLNKVYSIAVDIKNVEGKYSSYAKFFDDDRDTSIIKIKLLNNNYPIDLEGCTVEAEFILANNTYHDETCKIINTSEGIVELQLCQECLVAGKNTVRLSILKENEIANTPVITYEVKKGLYSDNPNFNDDPLTPVLSQMLLDVKVTKANQIELQERYEQSFPRIELKIKEVDEKIKEVNLAIASGTQDLEVKEARANKKGIVYAKLGDRLDEVDSQLEQIENEKISYPILTGEVGVLDVRYNYGDVRRYGAIKQNRNQTIDDTPFFQNAIDSSYNLGIPVLVTEGIYTIKNTLYLPINITIKGINNKISYRGQVDGTVIETYAKELFKPKTTNNCRLMLSDIFFYNRGIDWNTVFSGFNFTNSIIERCDFNSYYCIFLSGFGGVSRFQFNDVQGVKYYFMCQSLPSESGITTTAPAGLVDGYITNNYINGDKAFGANCFTFKTKTASSSYIQNNYIDFFKTVFDATLTEDLYITNNTIEWFWRLYVGVIKGINFTNNIVRHCMASKRNQTFTMPFNPESDIDSKEWICFAGKKDIEYDYGFCSILISQNSFSYIDKVFHINGANKRNIKISNNKYEEVTERIIYEVDGFRNGTDQIDIYIEDLMYKTYSELPSPLIFSTNPKVVTFNKQKIIYNNKVLINIDGSWYDMNGNIVTS